MRDCPRPQPVSGAFWRAHGGHVQVGGQTGSKMCSAFLRSAIWSQTRCHRFQTQDMCSTMYTYCTLKEVSNDRNIATKLQRETWDISLMIWMTPCLSYLVWCNWLPSWLKSRESNIDCTRSGTAFLSIKISYGKLPITRSPTRRVSTVNGISIMLRKHS